MKIGITGCTGTIGKEIKKRFKKKIICFNGDLQDKKYVDSWIRQNEFDYLIHLAAIVPIQKINKNKKLAYNINFKGTCNLVNSIKKNYKKKIWFFYSSTSHVYGFNSKFQNEKSSTKPITYYGKTKLLGEKYILKNKKYFNVCIGRIFSFTSKNQKKYYLIPNLIKKLKSKKKELNFDNLNHIRDFINLKDVVNAIHILLKKRSSGVYNICSNKKIDLSDILLTLNKKYKKNLKISNLYKKTILVGSNKKLMKIGWSPTPFNLKNI